VERGGERRLSPDRSGRVYVAMDRVFCIRANVSEIGVIGCGERRCSC